MGLAGAWTTSFSLIMEPGETALVDLDILGLPREARLIKILVSEANGFIPIEVAYLGRPDMEEPPRSFVLHAFPDDSKWTANEDFLCSVVHTFPSEEGTLIENLTEPFLRLSGGDRRMLPLLLFAVIETGIRRVVRWHYASFTTPAKAKTFSKFLKLDDAFSMILPSIIASICNTGVPFPQIREADIHHLLKLKDKRNTVSHRLMTDHADLDEIIATLFVAAQLHYLEQTQLGKLLYDPDTQNSSVFRPPDCNL